MCPVFQIRKITQKNISTTQTLFFVGSLTHLICFFCILTTDNLFVTFGSQRQCFGKSFTIFLLFLMLKLFNALLS